jgi:hypothetical protein
MGDEVAMAPQIVAMEFAPDRINDLTGTAMKEAQARLDWRFKICRLYHVC